MSKIGSNLLSFPLSLASLEYLIIVYKYASTDTRTQAHTLTVTHTHRHMHACAQDLAPGVVLREEVSF